MAAVEAWSLIYRSVDKRILCVDPLKPTKRSTSHSVSMYCMIRSEWRQQM